MLKQYRDKAMLAVAMLFATTAALASTDPWDAAFSSVSTGFGNIIDNAYTVMGVVAVGLVIFGLVKTLIKRSK